jgi:hypothetical protein
MNKLESQLPARDLAFEGKAGGKGGASLRRFFGLQGCAENHIRDGDFQTRHRTSPDRFFRCRSSNLESNIN